MNKNIILIISSIVIISTLCGCNLSKSSKNINSIDKNIENLNSTNVKSEIISNQIDNKSSNYIKIKDSDSENIKLYKQAYNTCYDLYKQGFILRNYVLDVEEMEFEHGKNTVYEIIYNCIYKDMDFEIPLESVKSDQDNLNKRLDSLSKRGNIKEYIKSFKSYYDKGDYSCVIKALLSDMSCDEFVLKSYGEKINSAIEGQKKILNQMKKELEVIEK